MLLETGYWRHRLFELRSARQSVLFKPRPELSLDGVEVDEFRIRAHDGVRLYGLRAESRFGAGGRSARIRIVGPSDLPTIDPRAVQSGEAEFVIQAPAGRKLKDRVLDVLRVCQLASVDSEGTARPIRLVVQEGLARPDEFLIASQLLAKEIEDSLPSSPLDDGAGWGSEPGR
jgi:hypothetical protein